MFKRFLLFALCAQHSAALDTVVDLGYAKYQGYQNNEGISIWAGMRYARNPSRLEGLRFTAPQDPVTVEGIQNATQFGAICIGTDTKLTSENDPKVSEDCLFANVFAPTNATATSKLPVYVFIQGGGFGVNSNPNYDGTKLIKAGDNQMVIVNFNYRVGPYGFLASKDFLQNTTLSLNNGLKDQRQLLKWVKQHIAKFGGDPDHVTLGGASAGGGSVIYQIIAYGGRDDKLFHGAISESPATPPMKSVDDSQWQYEALMKQLGCSDFKCLVNMDAVTFQKAVRELRTPLPGAVNPPIFLWNPTLDNDFVQDFTYNEFQKNRFVKVPTIIGDTTNEGLGFTDKSVTSLKSAFTFVSDQFPNLGAKDQSAVQAIWAGPKDTAKDALWRNHASDIYGHIRYICPGLNFSASYAVNGTFPTWQYRWNVGQALHVEELGSVWGGGKSASNQFVQSYWASFIRSFDPNKFPAKFSGEGVELTSPEWKEFGTVNEQRMLFNDSNVVQMETVSTLERTRCDLISSLRLQQSEKDADQASGQIPAAGGTAGIQKGGSGSNGSKPPSASSAAMPAATIAWTTGLVYMTVLFALLQ